jgi:hypothetical protein
MEPDFHRHLEWWREFWGTSEVSTGDAAVDRFREISLYTIACQATPWSIPPTVTERHWGAGAFHDEFYPFVGLLASGHSALARRVPYYRLSTLHVATLRARGQGALYAWSATEDGSERDPHGHWYTERFHLGQIAAAAWLYWLYERRIEYLEDLYPVVRETARYFELQMLERDDRGSVRTKPCTDFDESAGEVRAGPFTMGAAAFALDRAAEGARRLGTDRERRATWERLAGEIRQNFAVDLAERVYAIPDGKPMHYSVVGYVVPFFCDDGSEFARSTLTAVHARTRHDLGFTPGSGPDFADSSWSWTAGHLAMCHSVLGDGDLAWDAVQTGIRSAGQFLSPNEHARRDGEPVVPWFTTGCGAWLAGLHWMFARVDDVGDHVLPAVPASLPSFSFRGLRLSRGVSVSARVLDGVAAYLSLNSPWPMSFTFEIPSRFVADVWPQGLGKVEVEDDLWRITLELSQGENTLVEASSVARAAER